MKMNTFYTKVIVQYHKIILWQYQLGGSTKRQHYQFYQMSGFVKSITYYSAKSLI